MRALVLFTFVFFISESIANGMTLDGYLESYNSGEVKKLFIPNTPLVLPLEDFQYIRTWSKLKKPFDFPHSEILRYNFKPLAEIFLSPRARRLTRQISNQITEHQINSMRSIQYKQAIKDLFEIREFEIIKKNKTFLGKYLIQQQNLASSDPRTLKQIFDLQSRVEFFDNKKAPHAKDSKSRHSITSKQRKILVDTLVKNIEALNRGIHSVNPSQHSTSLAKTELELKKVEDTMKGSGLLQGITHFEVRRDYKDYETTYRIGISFPLDAFGDRDVRQQALRLASEVRLEVEENQLKEKFLESKKQFFTLATSIRVLQSRLNKIISITKNSPSTRIRASMTFLLLETQLDLLQMSQEFYLSFIETLTDYSMFSTYSEKNLLQPSSWKGIAL